MARRRTSSLHYAVCFIRPAIGRVLLLLRHGANPALLSPRDWMFPAASSSGEAGDPELGDPETVPVYVATSNGEE